MTYELPSLQKKIDEFNELFELDDGWNVRYEAEEEVADGRYYILVHIYDYSEMMTSDEFYGVGEYGNLFRSYIESFEKAVQEDTGDDSFYLEPYSYAGHFIGRAWLRGRKLFDTFACKNAVWGKRLSMKKKASDGWSREKCSELILALHRCEALLYEIENSRRGHYVPIVGNTYRELSRYAERLGESIVDAAREIDGNYGWMKSDDIDFEDYESEEW